MRSHKKILHQDAKDLAAIKSQDAALIKSLAEAFEKEVYKPFKDSKNTRLASPLRETTPQPQQ